MKNIYLVDVSSMFFRAFYAIPPLTNDKGLPTNALYGFLTMTLKLLREVKPDHLGFCFDRPEPSFRLQLYDQYKANRSEMPEDLVAQVPYIRKLTEVLGIQILEQVGFEADDIIGTYTRYAREQHLNVVIVSGDKDFAQLVGPGVTLYDTMKDLRFDSAAVISKWGVRPDQMIDYLSIVGDSSDNVPGIKGIGVKGAQKLLQEYGSLDGIYKNIDKISSKSTKQKLIDSRDMAFLSQKLVTIHQEAALPKKIEDLKLKSLDIPRVTELLQELGFKTILKSLQSDESQTTKGKALQPVSVDSSTPAARRPRSMTSKILVVPWAEWIQGLEPYSFVHLLDTGRGLYACYKRRMTALPPDNAEVTDILSRRHLKFLGFDLKENWKILNLRNPVAAFDCQLAAYVIRSAPIDDFLESYKLFLDDSIPDLASPEEMFDCLFELEQKLKSELARVDVMKVFEKIELPTASVLYDMEQIGILIDKDLLKEQSQELQNDLSRLEKQIFEHSGGPFNIGSPKQLGQVLFERLNLPVMRKTKTGFSTDSDVLEKLQLQHPIASLLLEYRELAKLKSTYVDALPNLMDPKDGRIHTHYRQALTTTGRLSSVNPNLQNIPIRTARGRMIRKAFIAKQGCVLISADYSQIELRILAHMSDDPGLVHAFQQNLDIHAATASEIFNVPLKEVTSEQRRAAKAVNFGIAYGQGAYGLSQGLGISRAEAADVIRRYFLRFPNVRQFMDDMVHTGNEKGYVETLFGRRRYLPELKSKNQAIKKFGERAAINAPMQGTASDLVKLAMIHLHQDASVPILLQVHDELIFECPVAKQADEIKIIKKIMEHVFELKVPLVVDISSGHSWESQMDSA